MIEQPASDRIKLSRAKRNGGEPSTPKNLSKKSEREVYCLSFFLRASRDTVSGMASIRPLTLIKRKSKDRIERVKEKKLVGVSKSDVLC